MDNSNESLNDKSKIGSYQNINISKTSNLGSTVSAGDINRKFPKHLATVKPKLSVQRGFASYKNPSLSWKKPDLDGSSSGRNKETIEENGNRGWSENINEKNCHVGTPKTSSSNSIEYDNRKFSNQRGFASYKNPSMTWKNPKLACTSDNINEKGKQKINLKELEVLNNGQGYQKQEHVNQLPFAGAIPKVRSFEHGVPESFQKSRSFSIQQGLDPLANTSNIDNKGGPKESVENTLQRLIKMEDNEVVFHFQSQKDNMKDLLQNVSKHTHLFPVFIELLFKVCSSQFYQNSVISSLQNLLKSEFPTILINFLATGSILSSKTINWSTFFCHLIIIFKKYFQLLPSKTSEVLGPSLLLAIKLVEDLIQNMLVDPKILKELQSVNAQRIQNLSIFSQPVQQKISTKPCEYSDQPSNNFRQMSVVLCREDIHYRKTQFLRSNIIKGSFKDVEDYLDVQFRLLREDFVAPLRDGIIQFANLLVDNENKNIKLPDLRIYNNVQLVLIDKIPFGGLMCKVSFDISRLTYVKWENTKRFVNGTLVCLSSDGFENFRLATIVKRDVNQLYEGYVNLKFLDGSFWEIDENETFVMIESPTYFEVYYPILEGLKKCSEDTMPFVNNIVKVNKKINLPGYLKKNVCYDLKCIVTEGASRNSCFPLKSSSWPFLTDLNMDKAQYEALKAALTRKIAIIQGPPGTGKTFLGLKIVQVLLNNKRAWNHSPILIICCTNHALDQFLEEILAFVPEGIVRVGGRSKSKKLTEFNISNLKLEWNRMDKENAWFSQVYPGLVDDYYIPEVVRESRGILMCEIHSLASEIDLHQLKLRMSLTTVLSQDNLRQFISVTHLKQLSSVQINQAKPAVYGQKSDISVMMVWLGVEDIICNHLSSVESVGGLQTKYNREIYFSELADEEEMTDQIEDERNWLINELEASEVNALNTNFIQNWEQLPDVEKSEAKLETTNEERKQRLQKLKFELAKNDCMNKNEVCKINNLLSLDMNDRWRLYRYWVVQLKQSKLKILTKLQKRYDKSCKRLEEIDQLFDKAILEQATIIGMTTNGAAKHRDTLQQVQPAIVIVEEAAEVLETHIITALSKKCEHLILIGDQKQLRPNPTVYDLAKKYALDVSLFERLINNGLPYECLTTQHRMRPEIASLLCPHVYDDLQNHPCVENYANIGGMRKNVYFLDHQYKESSLNDSKSKSNQFEAIMIVELSRYLLLQGYEPTQITILSTYLGQIFLIRRLMKNTIAKNVHCTVVDNFQGEENDIILLSLVRSNDENNLGFLKIENRVCVALSRAKKGFYCIGNFQLLTSQAEIWTSVVNTLQKMDAIGPAFPLICQNHPLHALDVEHFDDFNKVPEGGCSEPCEYRLSCGHKCEKVCHIIDKDHINIRCLKTCSKVLCDKGHKCPKPCHKTCGECEADVKVLSDCGHFNTVPCFEEHLFNFCSQPCSKILSCGHQCDLLCGNECDAKKCKVLIEQNSPCGHLVKIPCNLRKNVKDLLKVCKYPCKSVLSCEHICKGSCYDCKQMRIHVSCQEKCGRTLVCGHSCNVPCAETCPPCEQRCENRCIHSKCPRICGDYCEPCREPCAWQCPHETCSKLCYEMCDRNPCSQPCPVVMKCGHPCIGHCGEPCPTKCRVCDKDEVCEVFFGDEDEEDSKFVLIEDCNHVIESRGMDIWMKTDTDLGSEINMKSCPKCKTVIRKNLRYGNCVKTIQNDVIYVKQKIMNEHENLKAETKKIKEVAANAIPKITMFPLAKYMISKQLEKANLSSFEVNILKNKVSFLLKMSNIWQCYKPTSMFDIVKENLKDLEETMVELIIKSAAESALKEFAQELRRVEFLRNIIVSVQHQKLSSKANDCFQELHSILTNKQAFTIQQEEAVQAKIKKLNELQTGLGIANAEKAEILKAMNLGKGHWFKCPDGHIYAIGECGGAMEHGKCPECGKIIGGQHHRLTSDNQLATEMDGAVNPAYPTF